MNYDNSQDAHKLSNYKEWKRTYNVITEVEINVETTGISDNDVLLMARYMQENKIFVLYGKEGFVIISPENNGIWQAGVLVKYETPKQHINAIKLLLLGYNKIWLPPEDFLTNEQKQISSC